MSGQVRTMEYLVALEITQYVVALEGYCDDLSMQRLYRMFAGPEPARTTILRDVERQATSTWEGRDKSFNRLHAVKLSEADGREAFNAGIEVRNAFAHALGNLTTRQARDHDLARKVAPIGAYPAGGRLVVAPDSHAKVFDACLKVVRYVDAGFPIAD